MPNISPPLKWLAEKRARVSGVLRRTESNVEELTAAAAKAARAAEAVMERARRLRVDLESLDRAIALCSASVDVAKIASVNPWQGHYGRRGALRGTISHILRQSYPLWCSTRGLSAAVVSEHALTFETPEEWTRWFRNSLKGTLRQLVNAGRIERGHPKKPSDNAGGIWRWKPKSTTTLADLRAAAGLAGSVPS